MSELSKVHPIEANDELMSTPRAKRPRGQLDVSEAPWKSSISALLTCVSRQDCVEALSKSFRIFNHSDEKTHDEQITSGVDIALVRLLSFLLFKESFEDERQPEEAARSVTNEPQTARATKLSDEITCACQITEMVYRCSKEVLESSFQRLGQDFLHVIITILVEQLPNYNTSSNEEHTQSTTSNLADMKSTNLCLRSVTKILCHFARIQSATTSMAHNLQLLSLIVSILQHQAGIIPFEAYHNALWVLANMACCNENMQHMASHVRLLDSVIQAANIMHEIGDHAVETRLNDHHALRLQHSAFRCLLNLSWDQVNKTLMSVRDDLVDTIVKTVGMKTLPGSRGDTPRAYSTLLLQTRLFALGTLRNIAHTPSPQKLRLCTTQDGLLLNLLCDTGSRDADSTVRDKTFAVIFNLVSAETADMLISHPRLLGALVESASVPSSMQGENTGESASTMSFRSLNALYQAVATRGSEECRLTVRRAIDQVNMARQFHDMTVPQK